MALGEAAQEGSTGFLTVGQALAAHGDVWECAPDGAELRQHLKPLAPAGPLLFAGQASAQAKAAALLRRRRTATRLELEHARRRLATLEDLPFGRLLLARTCAGLRREIAALERRLAQLPEQPAIMRLDPDALTRLRAPAAESGRREEPATPAPATPTAAARSDRSPDAPLEQPITDEELLRLASDPLDDWLVDRSLQAQALRPFEESELTAGRPRR